MSAVDADGNAVALTYTNGLFFGSGTWVRGMFLNSAMLNFSRTDSGPNTRGPHRVPTSTIAPSIVLDAAGRLGYRIQTTPPTDLTFGGVHVIARIDGHWVGAADPRRDGEVRGY